VERRVAPGRSASANRSPQEPASLMFAILRDFRSSLGALVVEIQLLNNLLRDLARTQQEAGPALDRIAALELNRHQFEAECEGMLLKADGKLKAAMASEARERQIKKANDRLADPFADEGEEAAEAARAVQPNHVEAGKAEGLYAMHLDVATDRKAAAVNAKWSR